MLQKAVRFLRDVNTEMAKVSWPTREELRGQTLVVVVTMVIFAVFIFFVDHLLSRLLSLIY